MSGMLAVFVGIRVEQWAVEGRIEVLERRDLEGYPVALGACHGKPVLLCRTGLGQKREGGAAKAVLSAYSPSAIVSAAMASSVADDVRVGDLVLCEKVCLCRGYELSAEPSAVADRRLLALAEQAAREAQLRYTRSSALTAAILTAEPLKRELIPSEYSVVDAAGHSLAEAARARGIPFLAVRVALGRSLDEVPDTLDLIAERGVIRPWRTIAHYLRRPGQAPAFMRLAVSVRKASQRLSAFMREFLREWSLEP